MDKRIFPTNLNPSEWVSFDADGFSKPVCGLIHNLEQPASNGMPLGGIDTGCIDLETSGLWGYCTIFNSHVPRRGPINIPFLGMSVGDRTWLLCDTTQTKQFRHTVMSNEHRNSDHAVNSDNCKTEPNACTPLIYGQLFPGEEHPADPTSPLDIKDVLVPDQIHYWGHYPIVDLEYETEAPVSIGLRAWSPFLPGDLVTSMLPGTVFEVRLRNFSDQEQKGTVAFSFPGPTENEAGEGTRIREEVHGQFNGRTIRTAKTSYALGVIGHEDLRMGSQIPAEGFAWSKIADELPDEVPLNVDRMSRAEVFDGHLGMSAAVDFVLSPGENKVIRFVLTWRCPQWKGGGYNWSDTGETYTHMYAKHYPTATHAAFALAEEHESILGRILAWQEAVYTDGQMPTWLQDSLINNFHLLTEVGMWAQAGSPFGDWCRPEDGLWGLNEAPRGCPQIECGPVNTYYGGMAEQYFFPALVQSTLRAEKAYQYPDGCPTWIFGGMTGDTPPIDMTEPTRGYQTGQNGSWYIGLAARHWMRTGDDDFLREFYPSLKKATVFTFNLNPDRPFGLISLPEFDLQEGYESIPFKGMSSHVASLRLYHLKMMEKMADKIGDDDFAAQCRDWFRQVIQLMEKYLWTGSYYLQANDHITGNVQDVIMGYQLDGEAMSCHDGVEGGVFPHDRVQKTLATLLEKSEGRWGVRVWSDAGGGPVNQEEFATGYWSPHGVHAPGALMTAMVHMYHGDRDHGLEISQSVMENIICQQRLSWDIPLLYRADNGECIWGNDYAQMMMVWALPAAVAGTDLATYAAMKDGLISRILEACQVDPDNLL